MECRRCDTRHSIECCWQIQSIETTHPSGIEDDDGEHKSVIRGSEPKPWDRKDGIMNMDDEKDNEGDQERGQVVDDDSLEDSVVANQHVEYKETEDDLEGPAEVSGGGSSDDNGSG